MENVTNASGGHENVSDNSQGDNVAYETYRKVLSEKKKRDEELLSLRDQLKTYEQQKAETEGRKDDVISSLRKELDEYKSKLTNVQKTYAFTTIEQQIRQKAIESGCKKPDHLLRLLSNEDLGSIDVSDDFRVNSDDLTRVIDKSKKEFDYLFKVERVNVSDVTAPPVKNEAPKTEKLTKEQLKERIKQLANQGE